MSSSESLLVPERPRSSYPINEQPSGELVRSPLKPVRKQLRRMLCRTFTPDDTTSETSCESSASVSESDEEREENESESQEDEEDFEFSIPKDGDQQLAWLAALAASWQQKTGRSLMTDLSKVEKL
eukprot:TRINITY_DN5281_c0_g1_i2.p1 TRINITY_DN5281_c0_g1~~TRINITY_DN5281_c0_g1_i2.p1  ORF type:complete len:126 (+),score=32.56 TRINITY_DN5281_c0_g1_i2:87-464(+)